jgi:hypothetical protein
MRRRRALRWTLAAVLAGGQVSFIGCGSLARQSLRNGFYSFVSGSVSGGVLDGQAVSDFVLGVFTGGFGGNYGSPFGL